MSISTTSPRRIAVIGGSGFGKSFLDGESEIIKTDYGEASLARGSRNGVEVVFLARHGAGHKIPPHAIDHRANIAALREIGVEHIYATAAVGSLRVDMEPGDFVILNDFVDFTKGSVTTFFGDIGDVRHCDFSEPYDTELRGRLIRATEIAMQSNGDSRIHPAGTYLCLSGPRYETPAEVRLFAGLGCDVVGMTGAPEAILCREAGIPYASVAIVTNYACGLVHANPLSHAEVEEEMERSRAFLLKVFEHIVDEYMAA